MAAATAGTGAAGELVLAGGLFGVFEGDVEEIVFVFVFQIGALAFC